MADLEWTVWHLEGVAPEFTGTEKECKDYVTASGNTYLYVQDPNGLEYEYNGKKWIGV